MNTRLYNAAKKYLIEVCREEDKYALVDFQMHLENLYSPTVTEMIFSEVHAILFDKYPDSYQWMTTLVVDETGNINMDITELPTLTVHDLVYLLVTEGKTNEINHKFNPNNKKLVVNSKGYKLLKQSLTTMFSEEFIIDIDNLVEITETV